MKINNNIQALNAYRNLNQNQFNTSKNLEKLSSGLRINRASDDAAGLAISEKMRSQIRGLKMAERNAMDGVSLLQTTEGAMTEVHSILQRMRELAVQGANDTNTDQDRAEIQKEIRELQTEIDSIAEKTEFNTRKLLNGESAVLTVLNENYSNIVGLPEVIDPSLKSGNYELNIKMADFSNPNSYLKYNITQPAAGLQSDGDIRFSDPQNNSYALGEYTINVRGLSESGGKNYANIEVLGPDGLLIESKAVQVGAGAGPKPEVVGGLEINKAKIQNAGSVKVNIEVEATLTLKQNTNTDTVASVTVIDSDDEKVVKVTGGNTADTVGAVKGAFSDGTASVYAKETDLKKAALVDNQFYFTANGINGPFILIDDIPADKAAGDIDGNKVYIDANTTLEHVKNALMNAEYAEVMAWSKIDDNNADVTSNMIVINHSDPESPVKFNIQTTSDQAVSATKTLTSRNGVIEYAGMNFTFASNIKEDNSEFNIINNALAFQIGPNTNQNVMIDVPELNTVRLGIEDVRVTTQKEANEAIFKLDKAIQQVSSIRAKLGATQNRLEHTISNLQTTHENLTASESRIRDADMALEMTQFTKNNILNQSATAMLAQANQLPQGVLQLLQ
ncbi:flagellin [Anaerobacillus sp. MEB173]|uniref:flagellin N-terminal helical domain-containing protein n=1 Tax=Anaerobacillus sp. MEB173 TaxID=3383345 RepID=UPI003F91ED3D